MTGRGPLRSVALGLAAVPVLVACSDTAAPPAADAPAASPSTSVAEHAERSDDLLARSLRSDEPGCSAAVGVEGEVVWAGARGAADLAAGRAIETTTTFDIGSTSKQFTATAVLLLAQDGALSLDDPLSRWVPDLPGWAGDVSIAQLMHHESGIPDYIDRLVDDGSAMTDRTTQGDALAAMGAADELDFAPGERFQYSNSNYVLLAEVVGRAARRPLPAFAGERIFEPLDLDMAFDPFGSSPDNTDPASARGYLWNVVTGNWDPAGSRWEQIGDGAVQTTPSELVRWADNYRTGRLGGEPLLDAQLADAADAGRGRYGAGIVQRPDGALEHGGSWAGYLTEFFVSEDRRTAVAVTCNGDRGPSSAVRSVAAALQEEWA